MEQAVEIMLLQWLFTLFSWYEIVGIYYSLKQINHIIAKKNEMVIEKLILLMSL